MTIDRAIEILNPEHREHYESIDPVNEACRMGMEALERTRWIPCSERMPEDVEDFVLVIVSGRYENLPKHAMIHFENAVELATFSKKEGWILEIFPEWENPTVTHWQPLPELPKG